jgi:mannosyltransferase OCH1-like enzyme
MIKIELPKIELRSNEQIPRIIHYCWFGGKPLPSLAKKCLKSWKKYLPDYKVICWDENSFDVYAHPFTKEAFESKKWAFITDYVRLYVLNEVGGVYMDSDVEVIKPIDEFLINSAFSSFESPYLIPTGLMASSKQNIWIATLLKYYNNKHFIDKDGNPELIPNTNIITQISIDKFNLQISNSYQVLEGDVHIFPSEYFCPMNWESRKIDPTNNSYALHHFAGSWIEGKEKEKYIKFRKKLGVILQNIVGGSIYEIIANNSWRRVLKQK